ncbi:hypothetical protein [Chryseobacterium mucoviscidosis]|uniref:hypothetical protein n=1 Tax=Chryseobacterium mucoviscidosis TaxID=1945581 RepID=UPI003016C6D4
MENSYNNVAGQTETYLEGLELAKKEGYTHLYRWVNSDLGWSFFAKSYDEAFRQSVHLYMTEKKEFNKEIAEQYYSEYVDIIEIDEEIENI